MAQELTLYDAEPARDVQPLPTDFVMRTTIDPFRSEGWERYLSPTIEIYGELQTAFSYFNRELFGDALPNCLITLQRKGRCTYGFFAPDRFANNSGRVTDEIALNPKFLRHRPFVDVMSTLVHEMVHLWQHHYGRPSRGNYHNKEWARAMQDLGLHPSDTGAVGGRMTGQQMTHYIIPGGRFDVAARTLQVLPFAVSWFDADGIFILRPAPINSVGPDDLSGRRAKFTCPNCGANAWGRASLKLLCLDCNRGMSRT